MPFALHGFLLFRFKGLRTRGAYGLFAVEIGLFLFWAWATQTAFFIPESSAPARFLYGPLFVYFAPSSLVMVIAVVCFVEFQFRRKGASLEASDWLLFGLTGTALLSSSVLGFLRYHRTFDQPSLSVAGAILNSLVPVGQLAVLIAALRRSLPLTYLARLSVYWAIIGLSGALILGFFVWYLPEPAKLGLFTFLVGGLLFFMVVQGGAQLLRRPLGIDYDSRALLAQIRTNWAEISDYPTAIEKLCAALRADKLCERAMLAVRVKSRDEVLVLNGVSSTAEPASGQPISLQADSEGEMIDTLRALAKSTGPSDRRGAVSVRLDPTEDPQQCRWMTHQQLHVVFALETPLIEAYLGFGRPLIGSDYSPPMLAALGEVATMVASHCDLIESVRLGKSVERINALNAVSVVVAHEIRQPIAALALAVGALKAQSSAAAQPIIAHCERELAGLSRVASKLRELALPPTLQPGLWDGRALCEKLADDLGGRARAGHTTIIREFPAATPAGFPVFADQNAIASVLLGIISNAFNAHLAHRSAPEAKTITLRLESEAAATVFVVEDNGPGIPEAIRDRLFESFITGTGSSGGFGLGLVVAKNIVVSSGGTLTIKTPLGSDGGTRVRISLPNAAPVG